MKRLLYAAIVLLSCACSQQEEFHNSAAFILEKLHNPTDNYVLVASHRGDWRNFPENSTKAIQSAIDMGVDIIEIDIAMTKDSVLILCHDRTLDRTTNGRGLISGIPYESIRNLRLKLQHGVISRYPVATLEEILFLCKDRIVVNIDKGFEYYDQVMKILEKTGTADQVLIKSTRPPHDVRAKTDHYECKMLYMPIIDFRRNNAAEIFELFLKEEHTPVAYEVVWSEFSSQVGEVMRRVTKSGSRMWTNSLYDELCGGLEDDLALDNPDGIYGRHLEFGATIIQTDRPELLLNYLRSKGRHN